MEGPVDGDQAQDQEVPEPLAPLRDVELVDRREVLALGIRGRGGLHPGVAAEAAGEPSAVGKVEPEAGVLGPKRGHVGRWNHVAAEGAGEGLAVPPAAGPRLDLGPDLMGGAAVPLGRRLRPLRAFDAWFGHGVASCLPRSRSAMPPAPSGPRSPSLRRERAGLLDKNGPPPATVRRGPHPREQNRSRLGRCRSSSRLQRRGDVFRSRVAFVAGSRRRARVDRSV